MGALQTYLLSLCIIATGLATIAGLRDIEERKQKHGQTVALQEAQQIVTYIQLWKRTPLARDACGFSGLTFRSFGYSHALFSRRQHKTAHACYTLRTVGDDHDAELTVAIPSCSSKAYVIARVAGTDPAEVTWHVTGGTRETLHLELICWANQTCSFWTGKS